MELRNIVGKQDITATFKCLQYTDYHRQDLVNYRGYFGCAWWSCLKVFSSSFLFCENGCYFAFELQNCLSKMNFNNWIKKISQFYNSECCCGCLFLLGRDPIFTEPYYGRKWLLYSLIIITLSFFVLAAKEKKSPYNRGLCENAPDRARMWKAISAIFYSH